MKAFVALLALLPLPIIILNSFGWIVASIWLLSAGLWKPIIICLGVAVLGPMMIAVAMLPGMIFAVPSSVAIERGNFATGFFLAIPTIFYTTALMVAWSYFFLTRFLMMGPVELHTPLLILSYTAAISPWAYAASQEEKSTQGNGSMNFSSFSVAILMISYIIAISCRIFTGMTIMNCDLIIIVGMSIEIILHLIFIIAFIPEMQRQRKVNAMLDSYVSQSHNTDTIF